MHIFFLLFVNDDCNRLTDGRLHQSYVSCSSLSHDPVFPTVPRSRVPYGPTIFVGFVGLLDLWDLSGLAPNSFSGSALLGAQSGFARFLFNRNSYPIFNYFHHFPNEFLGRRPMSPITIVSISFR
jgi:hypothetical protein